MYKFLGYLYRSLAIRHSIALVSRTRGNTINYADCKFTGKRQIKLHAGKKQQKDIFQWERQTEWDRACAELLRQVALYYTHRSVWVYQSFSFVAQCGHASMMRRPHCKHKRYLMSYVNFYFSSFPSDAKCLCVAYREGAVAVQRPRRQQTNMRQAKNVVR